MLRTVFSGRGFPCGQHREIPLALWWNASPGPLSLDWLPLTDVYRVYYADDVVVSGWVVAVELLDSFCGFAHFLVGRAIAVEAHRDCKARRGTMGFHQSLKLSPYFRFGFRK